MNESTLRATIRSNTSLERSSWFAVPRGISLLGAPGSISTVIWTEAGGWQVLGLIDQSKQQILAIADALQVARKPG